jgi:hypothetical protein
MSDKIEKSSVYTTIQIRKDINKHIRKLCKEKGWLASTLTENYWISLISASMSGSVSV